MIYFHINRPSVGKIINLPPKICISLLKLTKELNITFVFGIIVKTNRRAFCMRMRQYSLLRCHRRTTEAFSVNYLRSLRAFAGCFLELDDVLQNSENKPQGLYFSKAGFEGLIFGGLIFEGAYLWREICVSKSIGLA